MIRNAMREKGIEPLRRVLAADPKSDLAPGAHSVAPAPTRTEAAPNRAEKYNTACNTPKRTQRLPVQFCWRCGKRYRGKLLTCATCPRVSRPYPPRAPFRRAIASANGRFDRCGS